MKKKKTRDTDYMHVSTRVRALENKMIGRERIERLLDARSDAEAQKVLSECGYDAAAVSDPASLSAAIGAQRMHLYEEMQPILPDRGLLDVFRIRYDYHNIKTLLKSAYAPDEKELLIDLGRYPAELLRESVEKKQVEGLSPAAAQAVESARELLGRTQDAQLADILLDRSMFGEMAAVAADTGSAFLKGYVALLTDAANLRTAVRLLRMENGAGYFTRAVIDGGNVDPSALTEAVMSEYEELRRLYAETPLSAAADYGVKAASDHTAGLTRFEKLCDDGINAYLREARYIPFGDAPAVAYVAAKENEFTLVRTIMSGRFAGLEADTIRERLRETYV